MTDEETPLLHSAESPVAKEPDEAITPLPRLRIGILLFILLPEPICSQCIYPFINQFISELDITGGDENKVGYYAGIIESLFYFAAGSSTFLWSRLSDHIGRKPVLMVGMTGLMISMTCFGFSKTYSGLVVSRCIAGLLDGNVGVIKSMIAEVTDSTNRARVSGLMPLVWATGVTIGPFVGGTFSRPHERFPILFGNWFWEEYPYLLPCLFAATACAFCFIFIWIFLKETVKGSSPLQDGGKAHEPVPPLKALLTRPVVLSITSVLCISFLDMAFCALQPLFFATPIHLGGLGLSPARIGLCLGTFGLVCGTFQGLFLAKIIRRLGLKRVFITGVPCFIPLFAMFPVINHFARERGLSPVVWALVALQYVFNCITNMNFGCAFLYVSSSVENPRALGSVNGITQSSMSFVRALSPAMISSLFAYTLQSGWLGGLGVYIVFMTIALCSTRLVYMLPEKAWEHR